MMLNLRLNPNLKSLSTKCRALRFVAENPKCRTLKFLSELIFVDNIYMNETCLRPRDRAPDLRMAADLIPGSATLNEFMHLTT
jgi:hypothetical protein